MPQQEPAIDNSTAQVSPSQDTAVQSTRRPGAGCGRLRAAEEQDEWLEEPLELSCHAGRGDGC